MSESNDKKYGILYVDDEEINLRIFKMAFKRHFNVFTANSAAEGEQILDENDIHVIVTDQRMPQVTGVEFLARVLPKHPEPVRMILTGFSDVEAVIQAINSGRVYRYVTKPWDKNQLKSILDEAIEEYEREKTVRDTIERLTKENEELRTRLSQDA